MASRQNLALFWQLLVRELRSRFIGSATGWLWLIVTPLLLLGVYAVVFGVIFSARVPEGFDLPFVAWLAVALWPWLAFAESVLRGSQGILSNAALIGKVSLPRELLVLAGASSVFVLQVVGFLLVLLVIDLTVADVVWLALPMALWILLLVYVLAMGLSLLLSALQVFVRDLEHFLPTAFMLWFFMTPILYPPQMLPDGMRTWLALNPMTWVVNRIRDVLLLGDWRPGWGDLLMLAACVGVLALGWWVFRRLSPHFEDFL